MTSYAKRSDHKILFRFNASILIIHLSTTYIQLFLQHKLVSIRKHTQLGCNQRAIMLDLISYLQWELAV